MYNKQIRFITADKREFITSTDAENHVSDLIHTCISNVLQEAVRVSCDGCLSRSDQFKIVDYIYSQREKLQQSFLLEQYGDDGIDWNDY